MQPTYQSTLAGTAYHEAGHIVAAFVNGIPFGGVTIDPKQSPSHAIACADVENPYRAHLIATGRKSRRRLDLLLVNLFAGPAAERMHTGDDLAGDQGDENMAYRWLGDMAPKGCAFIGDEVFELHLSKMRRRAERLIRANWEIVEALAEPLLDRQTMSFDEVLVVLSRFAEA